MAEDDRWRDRVEADVQRIEGDVKDVLRAVQALERKVDIMIAEQRGRADEDTAIRALPGRVSALEASDGARHWIVRLVESDRGNNFLRLALVAMVASFIALGGGLAASDVPALFGFGGPTMISSGHAPAPTPVPVAPRPVPPSAPVAVP